MKYLREVSKLFHQLRTFTWDADEGNESDVAIITSRTQGRTKG